LIEVTASYLIASVSFKAYYPCGWLALWFERHAWNITQGGAAV